MREGLETKIINAGFESIKLIKISDTNKIYCGCYSCLNTFKFIEIKIFLKYDQIALCRICKTDSVIGSELPIDDIELIKLEKIMFGLMR